MPKRYLSLITTLRLDGFIHFKQEVEELFPAATDSEAIICGGAANFGLREIYAVIFALQESGGVVGCASCSK